MTDTTHDADQALGDSAADAAGLMDQIIGGVVAQVLHGIAALRIADHLADGPRTAEVVAERAGSDARATYRLMRTTASLGVKLLFSGHARILARHRVVADDAARLYPGLVDCQRGGRSPVMRSLTSRRAS